MTTRILILSVLRAEARPMTLAEIGKRIGISPQLARVHVKSLVQAGLAESAGVVPAINGKTAQTFRSARTPTVKESLQVDRPREHISSPNCWCEPFLWYEDDTGDTYTNEAVAEGAAPEGLRPLYDRPKPDDTALLREALKALEFVQSIEQLGAVTAATARKAIAALRERLGDGK